MTAAVESFDRINRSARPYPAYVLPVYGTGLCLFAAGFLGWNDVIHMVRNEMKIDCVDVDKEKLWEMASLYPSGLAYHVEDAWAFAERAVHDGRKWDVVSVDPFFGDAASRAWETLYLWTSLASQAVTLTVKTDTHLNVPDGWTGSFFPRSDSAAWLVMQRA